jgi:hypothetical protein
MKVMVKSLVLAACGFVGICQRFGDKCCLHFQGSSDNAGESGVLFRV